MGAGRLYGLDALRGIAALFVFAEHFSQAYGLPIPKIAAGAAVDLFFALSGFVMARTYEAQMRDGLRAGDFLAVRYRRLWGCAAFGSTLGLVLIFVSGRYDPAVLADFAATLLFLPAVWSANYFAINLPVWSLFVEVVMNALHASVLGRMKDRILALLLAFCLVLLIASKLVGGQSYITDAQSLSAGLSRGLFYYVLGIWLFRRYGDAPLRIPPFMAISLLVACLVSIDLFHHLFFTALFLVACPVIIRGAIHLPKSGWAFWLGAISYPLYAVHLPIVGLARHLEWSPVTALVVIAGATIAATLLFEVKRKTVVPALLPA